MKGGRTAMIGVPVAVLVLAGWVLLSDDGEWGEGAGDAQPTAPTGVEELPAPFEAPSPVPERLAAAEPPAESIPTVVPNEVPEDIGPPDLAGIVVRRADSTPLPYVIVTLGGADGQIAGATALTDVDGRFELRFGAAEPNSLMARWFRGAEVEHTTSIEYGADGKPTGPPVTETSLKVTSGDVAVSSDLALAPRDLGRDDLLIEIDTGWNLTGYVGDDAANPVEGALVVAGPSDGPHARAGADGRFVIRDLLRTDEPQRVTASSNGYVAHELQVESPPEHTWEQDVTFSLSEGGTLVGFVRASTGEPLPRAWVTVVVTDRDGGSPREFQGLSKEQGDFIVDGIPGGFWNVHVRWDLTSVSREVPGAPARLLPLPHSLYVSGVRIGRGQQTERDFVLQIGAMLSGVVEELGGSPLASHTVEVWHELDGGKESPLFNLEAQRVTDREGRFHFTGLFPGWKRVRVIGPEGDDVHQDAIASTSKQELVESIELPRTGLVDVVLIVGGAGGGWVRGRVVDVAGLPLAGTHVQDSSGDPDRRFVRALAQEDGTFAFRMAVETETGIDFVHPGLLPKTVILQPSEGEIDLGDIVMHRAPGVLGLVIDVVTGEPVTLFQAIFAFDRARQGRPMTAIGSGLGDTFRVRRVSLGEKAETIELQAAPGTFQFWGDRPFGDFQLTIRAVGYADWSHKGSLKADQPPLQFLVELQRD